MAELERRSRYLAGLQAWSFGGVIDTLSVVNRSRNMAAIRSKGMKPEIIVRKLVHSLGYRFRLHSSDLPGKPDLVFKSRRKLILVHGCFWHQHKKKNCADARLPRTNRQYWHPKLARNVQRDAANLILLRRNGWKVLVVWECQTRNIKGLKRRVTAFLAEKDCRLTHDGCSI